MDDIDCLKHTAGRNDRDVRADMAGLFNDKITGKDIPVSKNDFHHVSPSTVCVISSGGKTKALIDGKD